MAPVPASLPELDGCRPDRLPLEELLAAGKPMVLRGLAREWGLVDAGRSGSVAAMAYLKDHYDGRAVQYSYGPPEIGGRPFYDGEFTALNCEVRRGTLDRILDEIAAHLDDPRPPTYYVASQQVDACLPRLRAANDLGLDDRGLQAPPTIWIGNRVTASCHYDAPNNVACCAVGRRRFTLFPPDQIGNLYPGPLEPTPGGQVVSVVDFARPDFERHPRFADALRSAQSAVLEPGDAIFIPSMWWHHVEGLERFNVLVNYWWNSMPAWVPTPMHALYLSLWSIRDRPEAEKRAWREVFEYYVFGQAQRAGEHLPEPARRLLGPMDETLARQLRATLSARLNR
jgi:hypothetical protein